MSASCCSSCRGARHGLLGLTATRCACSLLGVGREEGPTPDGGKGGAPEGCCRLLRTRRRCPLLGFDVLHGAMTYLLYLGCPLTRAYSSSKTRSSRAKRRVVEPQKKKLFRIESPFVSASKDKVVGERSLKGESRGIPQSIRLQAGGGILPPCRMGVTAPAATSPSALISTLLHSSRACSRFRALDVTSCSVLRRVRT